jgi:hypothetical protein
MNKRIPDAPFHAFVSRGPNAGTLLFHHKHEDGAYVFSIARFERDYIRLILINCSIGS